MTIRKMIHTAQDLLLKPFRLKLAAAVLMSGFFLAGCEKFESLKKHNTGSSSSGETNYYIHMTDAPGLFDEVNVDLQSVLIKTSDGKEVTLNVNAGIYNLLDFSNGLDTLIASATLDSCTVSQIRLVLGKNNSVVVDSVSYPLIVPSGSQSGLKLQVHQVLQGGVDYHVLLDFDANQSVVRTGNGKYLLKPVIRTVNNALNGSIRGAISPAGVNAVATAVKDSVSYSSPVDAQGQFIIKGLEPGTYDVTLTPDSPYNPVSVNGVIVVKGISTNIGTVNL